MFAAPQTPDGWVTTVAPTDDDRYEVEVTFPYPPALAAEAAGREGALVFAARSRLARLGINVMPTSPLVSGGEIRKPNRLPLSAFE